MVPRGANSHFGLKVNQGGVCASRPRISQQLRHGRGEDEYRSASAPRTAPEGGAELLVVERIPEQNT